MSQTTCLLGSRMRRRAIQLTRTEEIIRDLKSMSWPMLIALGLGFLASTSGTFAVGDTSKEELVVSAREVSSTTFPNIEETSDSSEVLKFYPAYLRFALEIGRDTDLRTAKKLDETYQQLRRRHPQAAAKFLKGLRFEMVQKMELAGLDPARVSTNTPEIRRWVGRFLKDWHREADEHLFRAVAIRASERRAE